MLPKTDAFACGAAGLKDCGPDGKDLCEPLSVPEARTHFGAVWAPAAAAAAAAAIGSLVVLSKFSIQRNLRFTVNF